MSSQNITNIVLNKNCFGCGACYCICPVNAIKMEYDENSYLIPKISKSCINCGKCLKVCPATNDFKINNFEHPQCIAIQASDEIRMNSSSGGIFSLMAEKIFEDGGIVIGAAFKDDWYGAEHRIAINIEDLRPLRGSKYVQSELNNVYIQAEEALEAGKKVLFTGCPCQVAGLYGYLGKDYENLFTADLVCHGVPSGKLLEKFVKEEEKKAGAKAIYLSFRDKCISEWGDFRLAIDFANGKEYRETRNSSSFLKAFLKGLIFRDSCGSCKFASLPRSGDITIADFWDIHRYNPNFDDKKGTSLVLVNNEKGGKFLESIKYKTKLYETAPLEHGIQYNRQIKYSSVLHPQRDKFFKFINEYGYSFEKAVHYAFDIKYDIGFVGWWYGKNWGSMMTCYAMNRVLTNMGKSVLMLPWPFINYAPNTKLGPYVRNVADKYYFEAENTLLNNYARFNNHCDTFIVGSDQLWNWWSNRDIGTYYYFLDFADKQHRKIAYSTSFGHDTGYYPEEMRLKLSYLLNRFDAISVREKSGINILKNNFDVESELTMDPVFLCTLKDYEDVVNLSDISINEKYVLGYLLNPTKDKVMTLKKIAKEKGLSYKIIVDGQDDFVKLKEESGNENVINLNKLEDWLAYFYNADYIVTDSFHGFCYSIIFSKQMTIFPNKLRGMARFDTIAEITGLDSRFVYSFDDVEKNCPWDNMIDFLDIHEKLKPYIQYSEKWLKDALEKPRTVPTVKELMLEKILALEINNKNESPSKVDNTAKNNKEYRNMTWFKRKILSGIQCYYDNGLIYTVKHFLKKIKKKLNQILNDK